MLRASTARTFSTSQLPKVVPRWCVLYISTQKCASRHNGVPFFISDLASWLRTHRFSEPTFRPSGATNSGKTQCFATFLLFRAPGSSCSETFSFLIFFLLLFSDSSHLCFSFVHIVGSLTSKLSSTRRHTTIRLTKGDEAVTLHHKSSHHITTHHTTIRHVTIHHMTIHHTTIHLKKGGEVETIHHITIHHITIHRITIHHPTIHHITIHHITIHDTTIHLTKGGEVVTIHHVTIHHMTIHHTTVHLTKGGEVVTIHHRTIHHIPIHRICVLQLNIWR